MKRFVRSFAIMALLGLLLLCFAPNWKQEADQPLFSFERYGSCRAGVRLFGCTIELDLAKAAQSRQMLKTGFERITAQISPAIRTYTRRLGQEADALIKTVRACLSAMDELEEGTPVPSSGGQEL